ncbi:MAG TPA: DUF397 domain-containing protein [Mycobacteriales bacterium]|nr:DUF397 domain-containing protein [Mycobacteriales bacterium]
MSGTELPGKRPLWRKSSHSTGANATCVEVAMTGDAIHVRDSKDPAGPALHFTAIEWEMFLRGVACGEFDL